MDEPFIGGDEHVNYYFLEKIRKPRKLPESLKRKVEKDPEYFVMEGGADGTLGHAVFRNNYGEWMPEVADYAKVFTKRKIVVE